MHATAHAAAKLILLIPLVKSCIDLSLRYEMP